MFWIFRGGLDRMLLSDDGEIRSGLRLGHARFEAPEREPEARKAAGLFLPYRSLRNPQIGIAPGEARRHDAYQGAGDPVEEKVGVENRGIRAEALDPGFVSQNKNWRGARGVVGRLCGPAEQRSNAQKFKRARG